MSSDPRNKWRKAVPRPPAFICPICGARSWNPNDATFGYCGHCHRFVDDVIPELVMTDERMYQAMLDCAWHGLDVALGLRGAHDTRVVIVLSTPQWKWEVDTTSTAACENFVTYSGRVRSRTPNAPIPPPDDLVVT